MNQTTLWDSQWQKPPIIHQDFFTHVPFRPPKTWPPKKPHRNRTPHRNGRSGRDARKSWSSTWKKSCHGWRLQHTAEIRKKHIPSQETNLSHRKRKGKSSTQKCLGRGYVSSLEGKTVKSWFFNYHHGIKRSLLDCSMNLSINQLTKGFHAPHMWWCFLRRLCEFSRTDHVSTWWKFLNQIPKTIRDLLHWYRNKKTEGQSSATVFSLVKWIPLQLLIVFCYPLVFLQDREKNVTMKGSRCFFPKKSAICGFQEVIGQCSWCKCWFNGVGDECKYIERERERKRDTILWHIWFRYKYVCDMYVTIW